MLALLLAIGSGVGALLLGGDDSRQAGGVSLAPAPPTLETTTSTSSTTTTEPPVTTLAEPPTTTGSPVNPQVRELHVLPTSLEPCGGDLPPCWVKWAESRGDYGAVNPSGCGGRGCFGAWQFSGEWAGKLGLPFDLSTATPEQQDEAARILWAGGRGCSNWDACNG